MSFIVNILVTLLHKGHIDIHFEVSTLIALGLVTFPWHTLHQFSRLQQNSGVVQDAKTSRVGKTTDGLQQSVPATAVTSSPGGVWPGVHPQSVKHPSTWQIKGRSPGRGAGPVSLKHLVIVWSLRGRSKSPQRHTTQGSNEGIWPSQLHLLVRDSWPMRNARLLKDPRV